MVTRMIFVNLPVTDLARARAFYETLGFENNRRFTDETAACMAWSDTISVMLLTHEKWRQFTTRPIPDTGSSEVMLCLSCESRAEVDGLNAAARAAGGTGDVNPAQDHGFMASRAFADPDGHVWEVVWMNPAAAAEEPAAEQAV